MESRTETLGSCVAAWLARLELELSRKRHYALRARKVEQSSYTAGELDYSRHALAAIRYCIGRIPRQWFRLAANDSIDWVQLAAAHNTTARPRPGDADSLSECLSDTLNEEVQEHTRTVISDSAANQTGECGDSQRTDC